MYYRHILNRREAIRWNHCNPALQYPFRLIIDDDVAGAAVAAGHDCWLIYDKDEKLLAQGVLGDRLE